MEPRNLHFSSAPLLLAKPVLHGILLGKHRDSACKALSMLMLERERVTRDGATVVIHLTFAQIRFLSDRLQNEDRLQLVLLSQSIPVASGIFPQLKPALLYIYSYITSQSQNTRSPSYIES